MHSSDIKISVELDDNKIPESIKWHAQDSGQEGASACKAMLLALWDAKEESTLRIDLWTKEMPLDEMKRFFYESFMSMADTYLRASNDEDAAIEIRKMAREFGKKVDILKQ